MSEILRYAKIAIAVMAAADLAFQAWFGNFLVSNGKAAPDHFSNIPFAAHGAPVFISSREHFLYWGSRDLFFILFAVYAVVYIVEKLWRTRAAS